MSSTSAIRGRESIHKDNINKSSTERPTTFANSRNSQDTEESSDNYASSDENNTQDYDVSQIDENISNSILKQRNLSTNKSRSDNEYLNKSEQRPPSRQTNKPSRLNSELSSKRKINYSYIRCFIIILVCLVLGIIAVFWLTKRVACSFEELQKKYPKEGNYLWTHLESGTENILNKQSDKPAVYLFVHENRKTVGKLMKDIANISSRCFGSSAIIENIGFSSKEAIQDYGHIIDKYRSTIREGNVILIANVNEIPGTAAKALHAVCDTEQPMVKRVIILLSLSVQRRNGNEKIIDVAENTLRQLWGSSMKPYELDPLITRVTDQVLLVQSD